MLVFFTKPCFRQAGEMILEGFNKAHQAYDKKTATDPVTEIDRGVENYIKNKVHEQFSDHFFMGEETATTTQLPSDKVSWIVDPVDGSRFAGQYGQ